MATYILTDLNNLFHRCKHAGTGDIDTKAGMALHICLNSFKQMWKKFSADHIVVCLEGRSWRKDVYPEYKAQRVAEQALLSQKEKKDNEFYFEVMNQFSDFLKNKTNVTYLQVPGAEADDLIARWIQTHPSDQHVIFSGDHDFYQLLAPNVKIYDGVKGWTVTINEVLDEKDNPAFTERTVNKKENGRTIKTKVRNPVLPPVPEYELFKKIIRGDASDNIMSAYPGVRELGTSKKTGIKEAFDDRFNKGFSWNAFMQTTWKKVVGMNEDKILTEEVKVLDEYNFNRKIIDLTMQPDNIKEAIDAEILKQISKPRNTGVGIYLMKFCNEMNLVSIGKNPTEHASCLAASYPIER